MAQDPVGTGEIPLAVFRGVVDNLIQNALDKRALTPDLRICVRLGQDPSGYAVDVEDDGAALPPELAARLFQEPLPSESGLGIGLYQSAALAGQAGWRLTLAENREGRVCFRLSQAPPPVAATGA
jgi:C4-dicarboxylate-specific signal transduction histidine kinase